MAGLIPHGSLVRRVAAGGTFPMIGPTFFNGPGVRTGVTVRIRIFSFGDLDGLVTPLNTQAALVLQEYDPVGGAWNPVANGSQSFDGIGAVPPATQDFTLAPSFTKEQVRWQLTLTNGDAVNPGMFALLWSIDID